MNSSHNERGVSSKAENFFGMDKSQYKYCSVCRRNHNDGRGHIFSKKHKTRLNTVLSKFGKKANTYMLNVVTRSNILRVV